MDRHLPRPAVELALEVTGGELRVREDGAVVCTTAALPMTDEIRRKLRNAYFELDRRVRQAAPVSAPRRQEAELGRELAGALFGAGGSDGPGAALARCLDALRGDAYVRLVLSFDASALVNLPWELVLWRHPGTGEEIWLGHDARIALSRGRLGSRETRERVPGRDGVLSLLHIGADGSKPGKALYERTCEIVRAIEGSTDEHVPRLCATSRPGTELAQYCQDTIASTGRPPELDIVHWQGHGGGLVVENGMAAGKPVRLSAGELYRLTGNALLYVVMACESGGTYAAKAPPLSFSEALLAAGAGAVLGTHDTIGADELAHVPVLYPLLAGGLPLDYSVQYLRRFFTQANGARARGPCERWYKLILHADGPGCLGGMAPADPGADPRGSFASMLALCEREPVPEQFDDELRQQPRRNEMSDQWDPKYPKENGLWDDDYDIARASIHDEGSPWKPAFAAVVAAAAAGAFEELIEFHQGTDRWTWQVAMWDLFCKPMFNQDDSTWPDYAWAVFDAVPGAWTTEGAGRLGGIPTSWTDNRRIWAFKSTLLFIAGLIEGQLPAEPEAP